MKGTIKQLTLLLTRARIPHSEYDLLDALVIATNDDEIVLRGEQVSSKDFKTSRSASMRLGDLLGLPVPDSSGSGAFNPLNTVNFKRSTPVVQEVRRVLRETENSLEAITPLWFGVGHSKKEIPRDVCYVGYYSDKCGENYVWVCSDRRDELTKFTLTINGLSTLLKDPQIVTNPGGPRFAPASAFVR